MTNYQAQQLAIQCEILLQSKQFTFGVIRRLEKNAKVGYAILKEEQEIKDSAKNNNATEAELTTELTDFGSKEFSGVLEKIKSEDLESIKSEMLPISLKIGGEIKETEYDIQKILSILDVNGLIE